MTKTKRQNETKADRVVEVGAVGARATRTRTVVSNYGQLIEESRRSLARIEQLLASEGDMHHQELMRQRRERNDAIVNGKAHYKQMYSYSFRRQ